jgi:hypothetical protein
MQANFFQAWLLAVLKRSTKAARFFSSELPISRDAEAVFNTPAGGNLATQFRKFLAVCDYVLDRRWTLHAVGGTSRYEEKNERF